MVGTKVLCIDDNFSNSIAELTAKGQKLNLPKKDQEYIIRAVFDNEIIGEPSYLLEGIYNPFYAIPLIKEFRELSFANWRFRTLQNQVIQIHSEKEEKITV